MRLNRTARVSKKCESFIMIIEDFEIVSVDFYICLQFNFYLNKDRKNK